MNGIKIPDIWFTCLTWTSSTVGITAAVMAIFSYMMGVGREYYHTSTPIELYGVFGWFTISFYLEYTAMISAIILLIILVFTCPIIDITDKGVYEE